MTSSAFHISIRGAVQGVGFRPFVYRLARELSLTGSVLNSAQGVFVEVEGSKSALEEFLLRLQAEKPPRAMIQSLEFSVRDAVGHTDFEIRHSRENGKRTAFILPDIATCGECLAEIFNPHDRRYRYPFTNCTNCGPRFSIIEALPYDRPNTSMRHFQMCSACRTEYNDPADRRFHAQPNACPNCGPQLYLWNPEGEVVAARDSALLETAALVRQGKIVALKGLGGFQLIVDARNEMAVRRLRERKQREEKPLALICPCLESAKEICQLSPLERRLLQSPESPIVLLQRHSRLEIAASVAPNNPYLGVMLPYTPLHHLLMRELEFPIVATSGNLSDEPICTEEHEALTRLCGIADWFLVHDRPIVRHVDDSVVRIILGRELMLRRARGYAPLPIHIKKSLGKSMAVGGHLKSTIALGVDDQVFLSQHIGDLETVQAHEAFRRVISDFQRLYDVNPKQILCDKHPEYLSTKYAREMGKPIVSVQHHFAHVLSCLAENGLDGRVLGISWDGTGYGSDGEIWGGEFLLVDDLSFERVAHLRPFGLPGGDAAIKQPSRTALGVLYEIFGEGIFDRSDLPPIQSLAKSEAALLAQMLRKRVNTPLSSSMGRLFDAVASIVGLRQRVSFEGQAAMELEFVVESGVHEVYEFAISGESSYVVDWQPMILEIVAEAERGKAIGLIGAKFHNTLAEMTVAIAERVGQKSVVLTGGCFQNKYLTERTVQRLQKKGFKPYWHQRVPPNDGGIALGQLMAAARKQQRKVLSETELAVS